MKPAGAMLILVATALVSCPVSAQAALTNALEPRIAFEAPSYDFGKVVGGEVVKHEFVFTNTGGGLLEITNVTSSCGCATSGTWTRQVEPGQKGVIPIEFHTTTFSGAVDKPVTVSCNDPTQPTVDLQMKGTVWWPIELIPQFAVLQWPPDLASNPCTVVRIVNNLGEPLTLSPPESNNRALAAELRTNQPGKEFELVIRAVPPPGSGNTFGKITMKTSAREATVIEVSAFVAAQSPLTITPARVTLPSSPLTNTLTRTVAIRAFWTNALVLSEPIVSAKGVTARLKELQPGRYFTVTLEFPEGFGATQAEEPELSVKSNHPQYRMIKVPIVRSAPAADSRR